MMKKPCQVVAGFVNKNFIAMKKYMVVLLGIAFVLVACQNNNKDDQSETSQVEISEADEPEKPSDEEKSVPLEAETHIASSDENVKAGQISKGDELVGMTVKSVSYVPGEIFEIEFEGEIDLTGHIYHNSHEYKMEFSTDDPVVYVEIDGSEYGLLEYLYLSNAETVKSQFSDDQLQTFDDGLPVKFDIRVKNPTYNIYFSDKGRQKIGDAEFVRSN